MVEMVDTLDLGSRFWGFDSLFPYKKVFKKNWKSGVAGLHVSLKN